MKIEKVRLKNFRNHTETEITPSKEVNIFFGLNGQGKTNILEALTYFSLTKSFFASSDSDIIKYDTNFFEIEATLVDDKNISSRARIFFDKKKKKKYFTINGAPINKLATILGNYPTVSLFPEHFKISSGAPADRRKFIDIAISQSNPLYVETLLKYKKALQQRNAILSNKTNPVNEETLYPWTEQLVENGAEIIFERNKFFYEFKDEIILAYKNITEEKESPEIKYSPNIEIAETETKETLRQKLSGSYKKNFYTEKKQRGTIVGPHRDDALMFINNKPTQEFASQGQQKSFLVALKLAEFLFLKKKLRETPVFILDDLFSELDEKRSKKVLEIFSNLGQTFISSTQKLFDISGDIKKEIKRFSISSGTVEEVLIYA